MPVTLTPEVQATFDRFLAGEPSEKEAAMKLFDENYRHRQRATQLKNDLEVEQDEVRRLRKKAEVTSNGVKEGEVVLSVDDAKTWKDFQELKVTPGDLKKQLEEGGKSVKELAEVRETERVAEVAKVAQYNPALLRMVTKDKGLHVELREVDVTTDGKTEKKKVAYVRKVTDDKSAGEPLQAYAERELKDIPLKQGDAEEEEPGPEGTRFPEQIPASGKASGPANPVETYIATKYGRKSDART